MALRSFFVTRIYEASLAGERGFAELNADLLDACRMLAAEDEAGRAWCRQHGYGGYTSYASLDDLPRRASAFAQLKSRLDRHVARYADDLALDLGGGRLKLDSLWVNLLKPGAAHSGHIHPGSVISGTVYLEVPQKASALKLKDPRLAMMMAAPKRTTDAPETDRTFVSIAPAAGTLLLWESFVRHEVPANQARRERVSLSFNYA